MSQFTIGQRPGMYRVRWRMSNGDDWKQSDTCYTSVAKAVRSGDYQWIIIDENTGTIVEMSNDLKPKVTCEACHGTGVVQAK